MVTLACTKSLNHANNFSINQPRWPTQNHGIRRRRQDGTWVRTQPHDPIPLNPFEFTQKSVHPYAGRHRCRRRVSNRVALVNHEICKFDSESVYPFIFILAFHTLDTILARHIGLRSGLAGCVPIVWPCDVRRLLGLSSSGSGGRSSDVPNKNQIKANEVRFLSGPTNGPAGGKGNSMLHFSTPHSTVFYVN